MARKPRWQQRSAAVYCHVMNRGHNRQVVFTTDADHLYFLELPERYRRRFAIRLYHYCLMSNHFHLLVQWTGNVSKECRIIFPRARVAGKAIRQCIPSIPPRDTWCALALVQFGQCERRAIHCPRGWSGIPHRQKTAKLLW
jgi:REP element-mobilizing transposase RayT